MSCKFKIGDILKYKADDSRTIVKVTRILKTDSYELELLDSDIWESYNFGLKANFELINVENNYELEPAYQKAKEFESDLKELINEEE